MNDRLDILMRFETIGKLHEDAPRYLEHHGHPNTARHSADVAAEAARVAGLVGADETLAAQAGWLHDVSAVFAWDERLEAAQALGVEILPEEALFPMILHQKLSLVIAKEVFGVTHAEVLLAIGCHTTLKAGAGRLELVLFVADKLAWDQPGTPPYQEAMQRALTEGLEQAALVYLVYLWEQRKTLEVVHPWLREAYLELKEKAQPRG